MENKSIYPKFSIHRDEIKWEDYLDVLTPIEKVGDLLFKREDYFAPLGYGGINGSKLRQAVWLVNEFGGGKNMLISGASVKSPQLCMSSAVATHYGLDSLHVIGATKPETAINHENVKMATWFGAKFKILNIGYNPVLQSCVSKLIGEKSFHLHYGITIGADANVDDALDFHLVGARQVDNIPEGIENLIIPTGSGNSTISILLGVMLNRPKSLKNIYLIGIGTNKMKFINDRLVSFSNKLGVNCIDFVKFFNQDDFICKIENPINLFYEDLHQMKGYDYQSDVKESYDSITFHPTYEAKVFRYVKQNLPQLFTEKTLFWIVGSKPFLKNMSKEELGEEPTKLSLYEEKI